MIYDVMSDIPTRPRTTAAAKGPPVIYICTSMRQ
jgi:hypothetical protein